MTAGLAAIRRYMTLSPHSIGADQSIVTAMARMRRYGVRHLPVLRGGVPVGIVSERDLALLASIELLDPERLSVEESMTTDVHTVSPDASLREVAGEMARRRHGSALVVDRGHVVGIFTTVDACRVLAELVDGTVRP